MAIKYIRADITTLKVDAIVNSANPLPVIGGGCDSSIYEKAGKEKLLKTRKQIGSIGVGEAVATSGYNLCKIIIHTVGPIWIDGKHNELNDLRNCYRNSLNLVLKEQCNSVAFPLISTGVYGFPKDQALSIAVNEINEFLLHHNNIEVILCIFDEDSFVLSGKIADSVKEYTDNEKVINKLKDEYGSYYNYIINKAKQTKLLSTPKELDHNYKYSLPTDTSSFSDKINYYIRINNLKPSDVYKAAWLPRRTFSRIMCGNYQPKKDTAIQICLALKLSLEQTQDLLSRNSMSLNPADPFDRLIYSCIHNHEYRLDEINQGLVKKGLEDRVFIDRKDILQKDSSK